MARKKKKRVASRGSVNNIILKTLVNGDKYGYEIIKEVEEFSNGKFKLKQPSLYSSLSRFEEKKYVSSYWGDSDIGGRRHYYHLTELGMEYYRKAVLKEGNDSDIDKIDEEELSEIMSDNISTPVQDNTDEVDELEDNNDDIADNESIKELSDNDIPAIVNFEVKPKSENVIIPDHAYYKSTPMDNMISSTNSLNDIEQSDVNQTSQESEDVSSWQALSNLVKQSNTRIANSNYRKLYCKKPKKTQKVILDKDGIYKLRDEDYMPTHQKFQPVIIDNVGRRTTPTNVYGYATYTEKKERDISELTDEEKKRRNDNFLAKFNLLTNSKMKPVSTPTPKVEERKIETNIDYRGKLNAIIESNNLEDDDPFVEIEDNNIYNYTDNDWSIKTSPTPNSFEEEEDNTYVELEPQEFATKTDDKEYIEEISNYSATTSQIKINKYENKSKAILVDKSYVLINKLRLVFGIIMSLLMIAELTITHFVFKNNDLILEGDSKLFIISYVFVIIFAGICIIPYFVNNNMHKANNFRFKYAMWFGILTFLVLTILIYCVNALMGFELDNFNYFAVNIVVPLILSFNFIIAPIIYGVLIKKQAFYD